MPQASEAGGFLFSRTFGGKSGHHLLHCKCPLLTQSGHAHELDPGQCYAASVG